MAVIKCKMCGGDLDISEGLSVCECEYCGTKQTVPTADSEKKLTLFGRANRLRLANEFDKAAGVYESIAAEFPEEAEAYWGLVLCRYGIEYVDDPATGKKVPTCHRVSFDSVMEDPDFDQACENADAVARRQYREEAKAIEDIRRGIIEVSGKEAPYEIFICYKETDENGERTVDSVIAQDVYDALTEKGYRVFFSRISLEDKLGTEYEPYIFAALNSAKLMLAFGTDYEYYNAVWVKNEWSRFLKLMEKDKTKHLIPCYKGIDAYDMPKEFHRLQAQDMGKVGAIQDLLRGVEKLLPRKDAAPQPVVQQVVQGGGPNVAALLQRGSMALEDGEWENAKDFFNQVLNMDAQCAEAWLGLALAGMKLKSAETIGDPDTNESIVGMETNADYLKFLRFASEEQKQKLAALLTHAKRRAEECAEREQKEAAERVEYLKMRRQQIAPVQKMIATGSDHMVGLRADGTVLAVGNNAYGRCGVSGWKNVAAIAVGWYHTVGLRADGTVLATGDNVDGRCDVSEWKDVVAIAAGYAHTVGLHADGSVLAVGNDVVYGQCGVSGWKNVVAIAAGQYHTVGLRADGTVLAVGSNTDGRCNVSGWKDVVAIAAGYAHTVGLRADGTVLAAGDNVDGRCDVSEWKDVVAIAAGYAHTVGLHADGSVLAAGNNVVNGQCGVSGWKNVVAIAAGRYHTVGLRADGTVVTVGNDEDGKCGVSGWKLFDHFDTLEQERKEAAERAERKRKEAAERAERERKAAAERAKLERKAAAERAERERREKEERDRKEKEARRGTLTAERSALTTELSNLKGLFSGKRRKEIEARLAEINAELKKLQ